MDYPNIVENKVFVTTGSGEDLSAYVAVDNNTLYRNCVFDGGDGDWGYKSSLKFTMRFENCTFKNGKERAYDQVRGGVLYFKDCKFVNDGVRRKSTRLTLANTCDMGIKAGVRDVIFENCEINDVLIGDYSLYDQQDRPKARRFTFIDCKNPNGGPIYLRGFWLEDELDIQNTRISTWFWWDIIVNAYWWFNRRFGDTRKPEGWDIIYPEERV